MPEGIWNTGRGGGVGLVAATANPWLAIGLWTGLGVFTIAFLVLMRTRWGNAKTVTKCVWLSIFAHLLLGGLAYGTKLWVPNLPVNEYQTVRIGLLLDPTPPAGDSEPTPHEPESKVSTPIPEQEVAATSDDPPEPEVNDTPPAEELASADSETMPEAADSPTLPESQTSEPEPAAATPAVAPAAVTEAAGNAETMLAAAAAAAVALAGESVAASAEPQPQLDGSETAAAPGVPAELPSLPPVASEAIPNAEIVANRWLPPPTAAAASAAESAAVIGAASSSVAPRFQTPALYSLRDPDHRLQQALAHGGSRESELAVDAALRWLAAQQRPDGHWNANESGAGRESFELGHDRQGAGRNADTAMTGLALLVFLGAGQTPERGEYRDVVSRGLAYLVAAQDPSGHLGGRASLFAHMYSHGIATFAVSEAYALTGDPALRRCVEGAIGYTIQAQDPKTGSWRYRPREPGDMSQFGWQIMALKSAHLGGIEIPQETWARAQHFVELCASGPQRGLSSYRPGSAASETMTAESLLCRSFLYGAVPPAVVDEASRYVISARPGTGEVNYYLWYYGTMALHQTGSGEWERWNQALQTTLIRSQIDQGPERGSWPATGKWSSYGGPIFSTALAALSLEVYYRYLPIVNVRTASR